ncbi:aminoglycoside phosphotransferase family protein [Streptomyces indicus]|uniref:Phosphotransferase enzyme family protein n=1 Tax=Streptomyces indicus TaxID=417292 RepID=A0A1G8V296_9ACTN|nr:aminoglycoside phosphotransferase family protein [Streptomyces indicus]SDJ59977.1 Phosphotransferase enzyme family protein [Streptomyces indicus]
MSAIVPAQGVRMEWQEIPATVRGALEQQLGARVVEAATQRGGFSPGVAARLRLADGTRAFAKAVSAEVNEQSAAMHRTELANAALLPPGTPAPRLLGSYDDGLWVVLLFEDVAGRQPHVPWVPAELDRVLAAVGRLSERLTPAPDGAEPLPDEPFKGWRLLAAAHADGTDDLADMDPWVRTHLTALAARERDCGRAIAGDTLAHADLRADNILLTDAGAVFVDWPHACRAARWFDLLVMLPSVAMQGGPSPETLFAAHPAAQGAVAEDVTTALIGLTGMFLDQARRPAPPGLPTLRPFQQAQGEQALAWLKTRLAGGSPAG